MKSLFAALIVGAAVIGAPETVSAQVVSAAVANATAEARARVACGSGTLVSAQYIGNGLLRVTCSQQSQQNQTNTSGPGTTAALVGTGLTLPAAAGVLLGLGVVAAAGGGSDNPVDTPVETPPTSSTVSSAEAGR